MPTRPVGRLMIAALAFAGLLAGPAEAAPSKKPNIDRIAREGAAYVFNVRQDPYESYDQAPGSRATITQQKTWLYNDVMDRLGQHIATLQKYPPKQKGSSLSLAN